MTPPSIRSRSALIRLGSVLLLMIAAWSFPTIFQANDTVGTQLESYRIPASSLAFVHSNEGKFYVSPEISGDFVFNSLAANWRLPTGSRLYVRSIPTDGQPSDFELMTDDNPLPGGQENFSDPLFTPSGRAFQYRIELPSGAEVAPDDHVVLSYLQSPPVGKGDTDVAFADGIVKPRSAWGADESLRTVDGWLKARQTYCAKAGCTAAVPQIRTATEAMPEIGDQFPDEAKIIREEWKANGQELLWPEEYVKNIKKFVVHHTAENLNDSIRSVDQISAEEYQAHVRSIYFYHAIVRGWGDIGYNYIIDPLGNVYQGRAGQDGVVGAHASGSNQGSVGISVMGNYENGKPPVKALRSLERLLGTLGGKYRIDPSGTTTFRGKSGPAVLSHRDLGQTTCPGGHLYADLPVIRSEAHKSFSTVLTEAEVVSGSTVLTGQVGQKVSVELKVKNNSTVTWEKNRIQLTLYRKKSRSLLFDSRSWASIVRPGTMLEASVAPGETATWRFTVVGRKVGTIEEQFRFSIPGKGWLKGDPLTLRLDVTKRIGSVVSTGSTSTPSPAASFAPVATPSPTPQPTSTASNPEIRIKLGYSDATDQATFSTDRSALVSTDSDSKLIKAGTLVTVAKSGTKVSATWDGGSLSGTYVHFAPTENGIVTIPNWSRGSSSNASIRYNMFRGAVRSVIDGGKLVLVNHLRLEDYLVGMAESYNGEFPEMRKVMSILTRSYALFYTDPANRKFPGKPYDGSDSPAEFQYYLGYGFETAAPNWVQTVQNTRGMVVKYDGKVVKTPYFSASDGTKTKDSKVVWGWSLPYLVPVDDSWCSEKAFRGHGVGLSACGAREMAKQGKLYDEIIKYYYKGVTIGQV